jgi:hypothetical protein
MAYKDTLAECDLERESVFSYQCNACDALNVLVDDSLAQQP